MPIRVVFDTNILVLYFLGDPSESIIKAALAPSPVEGEAKPLSFYYSEATFTEYETVFEELRIENPQVFTRQRVAAFLSLIRQRGHFVHFTDTLDACSHEPDNRFLECAVSARADYLVTVNIRHFPALYRGIETMPPGRFFEMLFE